MSYKIPEWFQEWLVNDYAHLEKNVACIKRDIGWIKVLLGFLLAAIITSAIAIIIAG